MVKSMLFLLSVMLLASDAQLSTVTKRYRVKKESVEFGRVSSAVRRSSRGEGQRRILETKSGKADKEQEESSDAEAESFSMGSMPLESFQIEASMSMQEEEPIEEEATEEDVEDEVESEPVPAPEPIGCNGDEYCPADMKCQCWLFCRFCFFPPCGTCVAN